MGTPKSTCRHEMRGVLLERHTTPSRLSRPEERDEEAVECTVHQVRENPDQHESDSWRTRSSQSGGSTTKPSREGNAVECGLIVIPTAGQRDPTSVE